MENTDKNKEIHNLDEFKSQEIDGKEVLGGTGVTYDVNTMDSSGITGGSHLPGADLNTNALEPDTNVINLGGISSSTAPIDTDFGGDGIINI